MQNILDDLTELLQAEQRFIADGAILKNAVIEAALNMDPCLLELLTQSETMKAHFFTEVAGVMVFDKVEFQNFVSNKKFLPDSYTAFKNRIGLTDRRDEYLSQSQDVVLAWPYKECVLEGGMTKEDRGRKEVFWNTTLAPDDITRLFEPKVLTGWERWDAEAVTAGRAKPVGEVSEDDNLLIKGNNLLALHSLKARYAGKVKLIYIDPPYNTGSDGFRYNDRFNHSAWLTFMRNRLEVAREMLTRDGLVFLHLDDGEIHYCKVLMDEVFGRDNYLNHVSVRMKLTAGASGGGEDKRLKKSVEHIVIYARDAQTGFKEFNPVYEAKPLMNHIEEMSAGGKSWKYTRFVEDFGREVKVGETVDGEGNIIELFSHEEYKISSIKNYIRTQGVSEAKAYFDNFDTIFRDTNAQTSIRTRVAEAMKGKGQFISARYVPRSGRHKGQNLQVYYVGSSRDQLAWLKDISEKSEKEIIKKERLGTYWHGFLLNNLTKEGSVRFDGGKKPEGLLERILDLATSKGDRVLDFFAGSGTLPAVAAKTDRKWLAVEQMDYVGELPTQRLKNVIAGEQGGISRAITWQGGGSFVYAELAASNATLADRIVAAQDITVLKNIYTDIQATGYLRYDVDLSAFDTDDFAALPLDDGKRVLMDCLDANHLYVDLGSLGDADFEISDEDAAATRSFYEITE